MKDIRAAMQRHSGRVDVCIVGCGAAGSTLAKTLAEGGMRVVVLEAGQWFDSRTDFVNDELAMLGPLDWDDPRLSDGANPLPLGRVNTGRGVGGSTVHFTAVKLRLHEDDFRLRSQHGLGEDWPLSYADLAPYYDYAEEFVGVSGPRDFPWGERTGGYPQGELPMQAADELFAKGMDKLGIRWRMAPHAILTGAKDGRSPCMYYGFCTAGCKSDAKGSALVTWVPHAVRAGAEIRTGAFATRIDLDSTGKAFRVVYRQDGAEHAQEADRIIVAGYSIETPRLLLASACGRHPRGLANSSDQVGRNLMVHPASEVLAEFEEPVDMFVTPPVGILSQDFYREAAPGRPLGYTINRYQHFPIEFATVLQSGARRIFGAELHGILDRYTHYAVLAAMCEQLPHADNRVRLADETDDCGQPVAHVTMSYDDNDAALLQASEQKQLEIARAAGAVRTLTTRYADHVLGTCRMGADPGTSVVDPWCHAHDVPGLWICDGSVFPTGGAVNPSLTIEALALRTADHILGKAA